MHKHTSISFAATSLRRITISGSALIFLASLATSPAKSDPYTYTYTGGGAGTTAAPASGNFSSGFYDGTNNGVSPASNSSTALNFGGANYTATDNIATLNINSLNFTNSGAVTLASSNSNNSISLGVSSPAINLNNAMGATGLVTINLNLSLAANTTFSGSGSATIGGSISGYSGLNMNGSGVLTLSGSNYFTGATVVNGGTLSLASTNTLRQNTNITINSGGTVRVDANNPFSTVVTARPATTIYSNGLLIISNNNYSYLGSLSLLGGTLSSTSTPNTAGSWLLSNGVTAGGVTATSTMSALNMLLVQSGGTAFNVTSGASNGIDLDVTGNFFHTTATTDTALIKSGNGVMRLSGGNSYTSGTTINGGMLTVNTLTNGGVNSSIGASSNIAGNLVLNGGTLQYTGTDTSTDRLFTLGKNGGTLDASGTGAVNFTNSGSIAVTTAGARTLTLTGTNTGNNTLSAQITDSADASGGITNVVKNGTGTWILTNASNSYTGGTSINGGILSIGSDNNLGATSAVINFNGGTLQTGTSGITSSRAVVLGANGGTIDTNGNNSAFSGNMTDATGARGALTKNGAGTLTLSGTNTYSGGTMVNAGVATGTTASYGSGGISVANGATVDYTQGGTGTATNTISGAGTATFGGQSGGPNGTGGTVNYTGSDSAAQTTVVSGTLALNNASGPALSGPVAVATGGALMISPNNTSNEIATAAPPTASPTVAAVTLNGGTLNANGSDGAVNSPTQLATTTVSQSMGALSLGGSGTLANPSLLNIGANATASPFILAFADSSRTLGSGYLNVTGYTGTTNALYIGTAGHLLAAGQLNQIAFNGVYGAFSQLGNGELVLAAAPEPSGVVSSLLGAGVLGGLIMLRRRRAAKAA